ncbi:glutamate dehydrogenase [Holotrichia oblita]|uniref:Glutamate dehydrogenase n=1 Tax=Holotrichia oblita TaxID=644536 RepID=A0ACB9SQF2_HOLOL|nr:glutamate dehydrogenase [Holotrichia oblita]
MSELLPNEIFLEVFGMATFNIIVEESNIYAEQQGKVLDLDLDEKRTLEEALQIAYVDEENNSAPIEAVYIKPPELNVLTDEESGDEETDLDLDRLSERQLRSQAEIKLCHNKRIHNAHQHLEATTSKAITSEATTSIIENKLLIC